MADSADSREFYTTLTVSENEAKTLMMTLDKDQMCEALILLKLSQHFGYSMKEIATALTAKQKSKQRRKEYYAAHKTQQNAQRVAQRRAATEKLKEEKQKRSALEKRTYNVTVPNHEGEPRQKIRST